MLARLENADDVSRPGWRDAFAVVSTASQMTCLNLRVRADDRKVLLAWMQSQGMTITDLLRAGICALLDARGVSREEVPLSWR